MRRKHRERLGLCIRSSMETVGRFWRTSATSYVWRYPARPLRASCKFTACGQPFYALHNVVPELETARQQTGLPAVTADRVRVGTPTGETKLHDQREPRAT
jgi:hypothetical protein